MRCGWQWVEDGLDSVIPTGTGDGGPDGPAVNPEGSGDAGGDNLQCPPPPDADYLTPEDAGVAGVQAARHRQRQGNDQRERSFRLTPRANGAWGYRGFILGSRDRVRIPVNRHGAGHTHTAGGGNTLSRTSDMGGVELGYVGDVEAIEGALLDLQQDGIDVRGTLTVLGTADGDVLVWRGRNLSGPGERVGSDQCE